MFPVAKSLFPVAENPPESTDTSWLKNESYQYTTEKPKVEDTSILSKRKRSEEVSSESDTKPIHKKPSKKKKKKKKEHWNDKERKNPSEKSRYKGTLSEPPKPTTIWIEETNFAPKDAYRLDKRSDVSNFSYDSLYTGDVSNYKRRFGNYCLGLGDNHIRFTDERNQASKKKKLVSKQTRYYEDKLCESSDAILLLKTEESDEMKVDEFLSFETKASDSVKQLQISPESYLMKQTGDYNSRLLDDPHNVQLWTEFIEFQDKALVWGKLPLAHMEDPSSKINESMQRQRLALKERKIAIYERALEKNPLSEELIVGYMELVQEIWDTERLVKKWKDIVFKQPNQSLLWLKYIEFCQSHFSFYRSSSVMVLYQKAISTLSSILNRSLLSHKPESNADSKLLALFILYCNFLKYSGFIEKATGLFQALIEFNICSPTTPFETLKDQMDIFESFWDEGVARIGEEGAVGWKNWWESQKSHAVSNSEKFLGAFDISELMKKGNVQMKEETDVEEQLPLDEETNLLKDLPCHKGWAKLEAHREVDSWLPGRLASDLDNEGSDVDHTVLFDDIAQCLFLLQDTTLKAVLLQEFLRFLGAPIKAYPHLSVTFPNSVQAIVNPLEVMNPVESPISLNSLVPCAFYQPCPALLEGFSDVCDKPLNNLLCHSPVGNLNVPTLLKVFTTRLFNHSWSLLQELNVAPDIKSALLCSWLQYELNDIVKKSRSDIETKSAADALQALAMAVLSSVSLNDYGFVWHLISELEPFLALKKKASLLSRSFLEPFTVSPLPRGSLMYVFCLVFVEYLLKIRKPINCYAKHEPSNNLALFALVSLASGDFNPTLLPISGFQVSLSQIRKSAKYYDELGIHVLSLPDQSMMEIVSRLTCCFYFKYLSEGLESSLQLMEEFLESLNKLLPHKTAIGCVEALFIVQVKLVEVHSLVHPMKPQILRDTLVSALEKFPNHFWFLAAFIKSEERSFITGHLRRYFNTLTQRDGNTIVPCLFAVRAEITRHCRLNELVGEYLEETPSGLLQRARAFFIRGSHLYRGQLCPVFWRLYIKFEMEYGSKENAKAVFYQAVQRCPWVKVLYFDGILYFPEEAEKIMEIMEEKELRLRTPLEEVKLLQEMN